MATYPEEVRSMTKDLIGATREELKRMQPHPMGTEPRTPREQTKLWRDLHGLNRDTLQDVMVAMAENAGHIDGEPRPCELCQFVATQALKDAKRK